MYKNILIALTFIFLLSCEDGTSVYEVNEDLVVSAFLYAGQPADDIKLTTTLPIGSEDTLAPPINNASIDLIKLDKVYKLIPSGNSDGKYYYPENDLVINENDYFEIKVNYNDIIASGNTLVPTSPKNVNINKTIIKEPEFTYPMGGQGVEPDYLSITWDNNDNSFYYVVTENIEENPEAVEFNFRKGARIEISSPFIGNEFRIVSVRLQYRGKHRAIVYKVNREYSDLYESRQQDSRNLNEPLSNIKNALGVFSAFASDTVYFELVK